MATTLLFSVISKIISEILTEESATEENTSDKDAKPLITSFIELDVLIEISLKSCDIFFIDWPDSLYSVVILINSL